MRLAILLYGEWYTGRLISKDGSDSALVAVDYAANKPFEIPHYFGRIFPISDKLKSSDEGFTWKQIKPYITTKLLLTSAKTIKQEVDAKLDDFVPPKSLVEPVTSWNVTCQVWEEHNGIIDLNIMLDTDQFKKVSKKDIEKKILDTSNALRKSFDRQMIKYGVTHVKLTDVYFHRMDNAKTACATVRYTVGSRLDSKATRLN